MHQGLGQAEDGVLPIPQDIVEELVAYEIVLGIPHIHGPVAGDHIIEPLEGIPDDERVLL